MNSARWLLDTDQDDEGMRVIADLHGGDPEDPKAVAEFREIKDKVLEDVCCHSFFKMNVASLTRFDSVLRVKEGLILPCGVSISDVFSWPCRLRLLRNS